MEQNQIIINKEKREQKARHYCEYTFKRFGIDAETQEAQLIRSAHVHGYNAGFEAARDEMLNEAGKEKWCAAHNVGANVYAVKNGKIIDIDFQGIWK